MQLVILAAGMGSRFGGLKQLEPIDDHKDFIIDYSVFDAVAAGFDKVTIIIRKENEAIFIYQGRLLSNPRRLSLCCFHQRWRRG